MSATHGEHRTRAVVVFVFAFGLFGCGGGGGGGGGGSGGGTASDDWNAARETPYQGTRQASAGGNMNLCLKIHSGTNFYSSEIYHDGYLIDNNGGGNGSGNTLSATSTQLGGLSYIGTLSTDAQALSGTYTQGAPASNGTFSLTRRGSQISCNWPLYANGVFDVDAPSDVASLSMALDIAGNPVLAWSEESTSTGAWRAHVYVARRTASGIVRLGGALDITTTGQARFPAIGISPTDGTIYVAWYESESTATAKLYVKTYNASTNTWSLVGSGQLNTAAQAGLPRLAVDALGRPVVGWWEYDASNTIAPLKPYVRRWVSNAWQDVGQLVGVNSQGSVEDIATNPTDGEPVVLWKDDFGDVYVSRWTGSTWSGFGNDLSSVSFPPPESQTLRLAMRSNGNPVVAWQQVAVGTTRSTVAQWDATAQTWTAYTTLDAGGQHFGPAIVVANDNHPIVAYRAGSVGSVYVKKWDGSAWRQMGGVVTPNLYQSTGIALARAAGDRPIVALRHQATNNAVQSDLYLLNWEP